MQLCKARLATGEVAVGLLQGDRIALLDVDNPYGAKALSDLLHAPDLNRLASHLPRHCHRSVAPTDAKLLAPLDQQEVWAAGVTYKRSQEARERESVGAARFYDLVYTAARPELFFKPATSRAKIPSTCRKPRSTRAVALLARASHSPRPCRRLTRSSFAC